MGVSVVGGTSINSRSRTVTMGEKVIPFHPKMKGNNITTINQKTYIDGYELVGELWKKTWKARCYKWF